MAKKLTMDCEEAIHVFSDESAVLLRSRLVDFLTDDAPSWHVTLVQPWVGGRNRDDGLWVAHDERGAGTGADDGAGVAFVALRRARCRSSTPGGLGPR